MNVDGPWLYPDDSSPDVLYAIARQCASGAFRVHRKDDGQEVQTPRVMENGPLCFHADLDIHNPECSLAPKSEIEGVNRALCRCGASANKPFCDGSHAKIGFKAK